jgi:hypothetical protein
MGRVIERSPEGHALAVHPLLTGSGLAVLSLPLHLVLPPAISTVLAGLTLALIAGVYLGFAFADGRLSVMFTELFVALGFTGAALAGVIFWPAWTAIAIAAHGFWDWAHHHERVPTRIALLSSENRTTITSHGDCSRPVRPAMMRVRTSVRVIAKSRSRIA